MCGIFGIVAGTTVRADELDVLVSHARQRGRDSSGMLLYDDAYRAFKSDSDILRLRRKTDATDASVLIGHSRLITNGNDDNQPVVRDGVCVIHNGIVVNSEEIWKELASERRQRIDTEVIAALTREHIDETGGVTGLADRVLGRCKGVVACAIAIPELGKLVLFSNNGSLYSGRTQDAFYFSSERYPLDVLGCRDVTQIRRVQTEHDIPVADGIEVHEEITQSRDLVPALREDHPESGLLEYPRPNLKRCTRCVLPETMPYIKFDAAGVCNFCHSYKTRNNPKPKEELFRLVEPYRRAGQTDCIVPFSGGRDSCYALHLIVTELRMNPVAYTYDWGMVTDLGRRNISRMCAALGVENIIVADDIGMKRRNIARNFRAWLKAPDLGMVSILTAGDKHFFRHVETVKRQTGVDLNLWGVNPLEVTHFKAGFLGVPPDFEEKRVYMHGWTKQMRYQMLRLRAMLKSPGYFNSSLWDTLSGEYYRSFQEKNDYFHVYDYWRWDEEAVDRTLIDLYDWETAVDTKTTWRIGDGTAAMYNYIYYLVAGFTEHDTFRSNQIREGQLDRETALALVEEENQPRYKNIRWYLDSLGMDFKEVITTINAIPRLY